MSQLRAPKRPVFLAVLAIAALQLRAPAPTMPLQEGSLRIAVIGDSGTGDRQQVQIGEVMTDARPKFPFELVLMLGDNIYGGESAREYRDKFELPYQALLNAGIKFYASLGNHDSPSQRFYRLFNMGGNRYYTFKGSTGSVRFFALDSNYMDPEQLRWLDRELGNANERWKICFFHHPIYSSGERHGSDVELRAVLEPLFIKHGVSVVFAGHEHFYERLKPQKGVYYFTNGGAAKLRRGNIKSGAMTAHGYDQDNSFMLVEIAGDTLHFQAISRTGKTVDSGSIERPGHTNSADTGSPIRWWPSMEIVRRHVRAIPR